MSSNSQQTILNAFNQAAGPSASSGSVDSLTGTRSPLSTENLTEALSQATQVINAQTQATSANTDALAQETQTKSSGGGGSGAANVFNTVSQFLGGGLSVMPLISLISGLFGGSQAQQPAQLAPYSMPAALNLESTTNYQNVVWGDNGLPRAAGAPPTTPSTTPSSAATQVTVQVQAIDSQSFLDHSDEIAQAVRQAMLSMHSINDVVTDL